MEVSLDHYVRNFRIFYQQLARGHRKEEYLNQQFKTLIEGELRKWRKSYTRDDSKTVSDNPMLNKARQGRIAKQKGKVEIDTLYNSSSLENAVIFGYLYLMFEQSNVAAFEMIQQGIKQPLADKSKYSESVLRKINFVWSKFDQIIYGKRKIIRFQKQLQEYFRELPQNFLSLLYSIITEDRILVSENRSLYFGELAKILSVKIEFFELNEADALKTTVFGEENRALMRLGYLTADKLYVFVLNMPQKQEVQLNKEITMQKFANIATKLTASYANSMKDYLELNNLKHRDDTKDSKISSQMFAASSSKIANSEFMSI